ncbi:HlyB family protein [Microcystis aeruginosa NIES-2549]|uniref:HlyB family protein n=1 Tax=Microcystis aeruginosa NIES-2549 TaxID=1641812 RepID=A0A0F6U663_MICAE|nr:peptidase domain-containing ABC transporter [Microcystis aeruginosa]AKE65252.1 HlyB family protein [Microcystis aeruginosa NIES-2549]AOC53659.1 HlyB family protein [Microcystis aeruginosa NIES-2481]
MSYTTLDFTAFLETVQPFDRLPVEVRRSLGQKLQPFRYEMGNAMLKCDLLPSHLVLLYEGEARLLGYDARVNNPLPVTLAKLQPGDLFGWISLLRGTPCETVIASSEVTICLTLKQEDFWSLINNYPEFKQYFFKQSSIAEVYAVLGSYLNQQAWGGGDLKEIAQALLNKACVSYNQIDDDYLWLVSENTDNYPIGTVITQNNLTNTRLLGLSSDQLDEFLTVETEAAAATETDDILETQVIKGNKPTQVLDIPQGRISDITSDIDLEKTVKKNGKSYPFFRGKTELEAVSACFQMLCKYFNIPFRKDVIQRILGDQLQRTGSLSLPLCGAVAEVVGLDSQLVPLNASSLPNINPPALIRWQDSIVILYEINQRETTIAVPERGIIKRKTSEFLESWGEKGEVILLKPTKHTQQQRFGLSWFWPSVKKHKRVLIEVFIASFFVQLFALANPLMIQVIIDKVIVQNSPETLNTLGVFLLVIAVFEGILTFLRTSLFVDTTNRIDMTLGSEIIDHLLRLPLKYFERRPVGEISTRINELENIRQFLTGTALTVVLDAIFSVIYIVVMLIYSPILTVWALGVVPILVLSTAIFAPIVRRQLRAKAERNAETQSYLVEVMTGIQTVKAQNIELRSRWQWQERYARYVAEGFQTVMTSTLAGSFSHFFNQLSGLLVLWVGAALVLDQKLTLGQLIAFRIIASYVTSPILRLTQLWQNFQETGLSLERLADIVDTPQEAELDRQNIPMPLIKGHVTYENLAFRFNPHGALQLYNVNLEFPAGTFVALVGESGAGKSTITKLLARLYEPESGRILIDGYDINKVELYSLRRQIGMVPQETLLFDGTVQENIALTNPDATVEEIVSAARAAAAHEFIMTLPNGYNTRVGERGASLSGGQRQRVAIARSVLQRPQILILDEATSALDYNTERQVCLNLKEAFKDHTVFFITHRLASIKSADVIVMMDKGTVAEEGTHEELMAKKGLYYTLYKQQDSQI